MTLNSSALSSYGRRVLDRTDVDQRTGQERADAVDHDGEAALDLAGDEAGDDRALLHRRFEVVPGLEALGLVARQAGLAVAVLERLDGDGDEIAGLDLDFAVVVLEFLDRDEAFGLQSGVDDDDVEVDADDFGGDEFALAHFLPRESDSSNSAAKLSIGGFGVLSMLGVAVAMGVGSFSVSAAGGENPFSRCGGLVVEIRPRRRLERRAGRPLAPFAPAP